MTTIHTINGDILKHAKQGFLVHGCNMLGVMGAGVAKAIADKYPNVLYVNIDHLNLPGTKLGDISVAVISSDFFIVNALTQKSVGRGLQISYQAIKDAFQNVAAFANTVDPAQNYPIWFPMIGAGLGGGDWNKIETEILSIEWGARKLKLCLL